MRSFDALATAAILMDWRAHAILSFPFNDRDEIWGRAKCTRWHCHLVRVQWQCEFVNGWEVHGFTGIICARLANNNITNLLCVLNTSPFQHSLQFRSVDITIEPAIVLFLACLVFNHFHCSLSLSLSFFSSLLCHSSCIMKINGSLWYHIVSYAATFIL